MPHDEQKFRNGHLWIINKIPNNKCTSLYQIIPSFSIDITEVLKRIASLVQPSQKVVVDEFQPSDWILKYVLDNTQMLHVGIIYLH